MLKAVLFSGKMAISDSGSQFWILEALREHWGVLEAVFFSGTIAIWGAKFGILEALREHWGVLKAVFFLKNGNPGFWKVSTRLFHTHTVIRYTVIALHTVIAYPHGY